MAPISSSAKRSIFSGVVVNPRLAWPEPLLP
jgi:hypothetical protein